MITLSEFMDIREHGFFRVAALSPQVFLGHPLKCADELFHWTRRAYIKGAQLAVAPELYLNGGYTLQDAHHQSLIHQKTDQAIEKFLEFTADFNLIVAFGASLVIDDLLFNGVYVVHRGKVLGVVIKTANPNYDEFTELRLFHSAEALPVTEITKFGQSFPVGNDLLFCSRNNPHIVIAGDVCEDRWLPIPPSTLLALQGAKILFNASASNFTVGKPDWRRHLARRSGDDLTAFIYANTGYGESSTGLSFDNHSLIADRGQILEESERFSPRGTMIIHDVDLGALSADRMRIKTWGQNATQFRKLFPVRRVFFEGTLGLDQVVNYHSFLRRFDRIPFVPTDEAGMNDVHLARVMAIRRRLAHLPPSHRKIVIALSGGKDSASILMLAVTVVDTFGDELGMTRKDIICLTMPGFGTTSQTFDYATALGAELEVTFEAVEIRSLAELLFEKAGQPNLVTDVHTLPEGHALRLFYENAQAWLRKVIELSVAQSRGGFVLGSTSASEALIGWFTLFGDGSAHLAPNAGVGKSQVTTELLWLAKQIAPTNESLAAVLKSIALSAASPELLPLTETGQAPQDSDKINGPTEVRDFFAYWLLRFRKPPLTVLRLAIEAYAGACTEGQLYTWLHRFITRLFTNWYKLNMQSIDSVRIGAVSPSSHDMTKLPSDLKPDLWLQELEHAPSEFR